MVTFPNSTGHHGPGPGEMTCLYCGEQCKRVTYSVPAGAFAVGEVPTYGDPPLQMTSRPIRTIEPVMIAGRESRTKRRVWCGEWRYYGDPERPFCRLRCAEAFGIAAARAGFRMKRSKDGPDGR